MGYPVYGSLTHQQFSTASWVGTVTPDHLIDDIIVAAVFVDGTNYVTAASAGWVAITTRTGTPASGSNLQVYYRIATTDGTGEAPTFTISAIDDGFISYLILRDVDVADVINVVSAQTDWTGATAESATPVTDEDECLVLYVWGSDTGVTLRTDLVDASMLGTYRPSPGFPCSGILAYRQQQTLGAVPAVTLQSSSAAEGGASFVIAFNNATGGRLAPDVRADIVKFGGNAGNEYGLYGTAETWYGPNETGVAFAGGITSLNSINLQTAADTVTQTGIGVQINTTATSNQLDGAWHDVTSTDIDGKIYSIELNTRRAGDVAQGRIGAEGLLIGFTDGTNYEFHRALSEPAKWSALTTYRSHIACGVTSPSYFSGTVGDLDWTAITGVCFLLHHLNTDSGDYLIAKDAYLLNKLAITGGSASDPVAFKDIYLTLVSHPIYDLTRLQGGSQFMPFCNIQIGDGTNKTVFDASAGPLTYPQTWENSANTTKQALWNVPAGAVSINVKASASDTINLTATSIYSEQQQTFTIDATSSASATYSTNGLALIGYTVTDNLGIGWIGTTFQSGGTVTIAGGGDLTNCTIAKTTSTNAAMAITANGTVLDGCTITVADTAVLTDYHLELGTAVTAITLTDVTFTGTSNSAGSDNVHVLKTLTTVSDGSFVVGVHYRINTAGTTNWTAIGGAPGTVGTNFTATGVGGAGTGTADQAVKITISGMTSLVETDVTTAGAPAWIAAPPPTLDATVLSGTRVVLYNNTTAAELDNTAPAGTAWSKVITGGASSNDNLTLFAFKEGYAEFSTSFLYSGSDTTILVTQVVDDVVAAFRTEDSVTDYTTLTEYNIYAPTIYIQADDADGVSKISRLATYYNGVLTTEDGARYFRGGMSMLSTGAVRINKGTIELLLENVSATKSLRFSDEATRRLYTDDGTSIIAPSSVAGSIEYAYGGVPDTVETGVSGLTGPESSQLMSLANGPSAATISTQILTDAQTTPIHSDVRKVVGITVDGTGTDGDPWGPQ